MIWLATRRIRIGTEYNPKALFDGIIINSYSISLDVTAQKKKEPGLLNLRRYEENWVDGFGILEDRLSPTDEKKLLKIFGNSVVSFNSLLLLGHFRAKITAFCFFFCLFVGSLMLCHVFLALVIRFSKYLWKCIFVLGRMSIETLFL